MPRFDRTFTSDDVIRLYLNNLNAEETTLVDEFFEGAVQNVLEEILTFVGQGFALIPVVGEVPEIITVIRSVERLNSVLVSRDARLVVERRLRR